MKALTAFVFSLLLLSNALAHTGLKTSVPSDKQIVTSSLKQLNLTFQGKVRLFKVQLTNSEQESVKLDFKMSSKPETVFDIQLPKLSPNSYQVHWIAMGKDGHKMKGNFSFTYQPENH